MTMTEPCPFRCGEPTPRRGAQPWAAPAPQQLHLWRVHLDDIDEASLVQLSRTLDAAEQHRLSRIRPGRQRRRFVAAHGALRSILSGYLGQSPRQIGIERDVSGKPHLRDAGCRIEFNMAHSEALCLVGVCSGCRIGIDIECIRTELASLSVARRVFRSADVARLERLPRAARAGEFFSTWTRYEAGLKARSGSLAVELDRRGRGPLDTRPEHWHCRQISLDPNYAAAVVTDVEMRRLRGRNWSP